MPIPKKLKHDTIGESVFELRFQTEVDALSEIILGVLYDKLRADFPKFESLPINQLPRQLLDTDPNLRYQPLHRISNNSYMVSVGAHVVSVHCKWPYQGWENYRPLIVKVLNVLNNSKLMKTLERFSLKYVNIITQPYAPNGIHDLNFDMSMHDLKFRTDALMVRAEIVKQPFVNVVQLMSGASMLIPEPTPQKFNGVIVDVDTIYQGDMAAFLTSFDTKLENAHAMEKEIYFSLLKPDTLNKLGPEY